MRKYTSVEHKANEFCDYTEVQLKDLVRSNKSNSLERADFKAIVEELLARIVVLRDVVGRF